jgi:hypothetical protein
MTMTMTFEARIAAARLCRIRAEEVEVAKYWEECEAEDRFADLAEAELNRKVDGLIRAFEAEAELDRKVDELIETFDDEADLEVGYDQLFFDECNLGFADGYAYGSIGRPGTGAVDYDASFDYAFGFAAGFEFARK